VWRRVLSAGKFRPAVREQGSTGCEREVAWGKGQGLWMVHWPCAEIEWPRCSKQDKDKEQATSRRGRGGRVREGGAPPKKEASPVCESESERVKETHSKDTVP